jgi:hypothetical protein
MTKAEQILQLLFDICVTECPDANVFRSRSASFDDTELPAVNIKPSTDDGDNYGQGINRHAFSIQYDLHVKTQDIPDAAADSFVEKIHKAWMNSEALSLLIDNLQYRSRSWDFDDTDGGSVKVRVVYEITNLQPANEL